MLAKPLSFRAWYLLRLYEFVLAPCQLAWLEPKIDKLYLTRLKTRDSISSRARQEAVCDDHFLTGAARKTSHSPPRAV
jgi:hypothetical protein